MAESNKKFKERRSIYADMSLLLVALFWGGGFVAVKNALDNVKPFYMMAIRFILAFILLSIVFFNRFRKVRLEDLKSGSIVGLFLFAGFAAQTVGLQYTTAGKQAFLTGTNVVIVPFFYWLISKKYPGWHSVAAAFLALAGIGLLTLQNGFAVNPGDSLTLLCAVFFAAHIVSVGYFAKDIDPIVLSIIQIGFAGAASILCAVIFERFPYELNRSAGFAIGYLVIFSTLLAFLIQNVAQKYTPSTHAAIILCLESVFGSILSVIMLGDRFTVQMITGCILIFSAIILTETRPDSVLIGRKKGGEKQIS